MSGGRGVCFSNAPTGMECLLLVLWREDPQVRLSMDESHLCPSLLQLLMSALLEVERSWPLLFWSLAHACSVSTSAFPPLILTRSFWIAGRFSVQLPFPSCHRSLHEETTASNVNPPSHIEMDDQRGRGEKFARKTTLRGSQFLPSSSPVSRFQPLYR